MANRGGKRGNRSVTQIDAVIGNAIKSYRLLAGMTQEDLAQALDVTFQQVQKYERGTNRVSASRLLDLSNVLGCSVTDLYGLGSRDSLAKSAATEDALKMVAVYQTIESTKVKKMAYDLVKRLADGG
jgi:transcriptional regulator with XRE-family HTH domain